MTTHALGPIAQPSRSWLASGLRDLAAAWMLKEARERAHRELCAAYQMPDFWPRYRKRAYPAPTFGQGKDRRPKWGQPGRRRKRRARLEARAREQRRGMR